MPQKKETSIQAETESDLHFGPFRLEQAKRLWRGNQQVGVRPRPLAVLRYLAERPGQVITGEELLKRLWPGIYVTKTVLRVCVRELRQALREDSAIPRFIETVGRQGYRFIAPFAASPPASGSRLRATSVQSEEENRRLGTWNAKLETLFVGRQQELARLQSSFAHAQRGERQLLLLAGEAGIGKTTLADRFLDLARASGHTRIGRWQCVEHYGSGEAYLPLLEALGQLCREVDGERVLGVLRRYAPLWLAQLSGLLEADEQEAVQRQIQGSSREPMLRELAEAVEVLAAESELILVLEDLQWSDVSTLEVLAYLAQRRQPARLYILGTYRPADVVVQEHPLRSIVQELSGRRQCEELPLELLTETEVEEYLRQRFGQSPTIPLLSQLICRRTDGNALFVVSFVDYLVQQGLLSAADGQVEIRADRSLLQKFVPETVQQMIARQIERLPENEQRLLGVASVGGRTFTAAEVAGVLGRALEDVEEVYDHLASREHLIAVAGVAEWQDETVTARYEFRHALYQQVLYEQIGEARRIRLHRQLSEWKERQYGDQAAEIAGELAVHCAEGRDYRRAVEYHCRAGETALRRSAYREAVTHCREGLDLLERVPDKSERQRQELALRMVLSSVLTPTQGFGAEELMQNLSRARELCLALNDDATLVSVLAGLGRLYDLRSDRAASQKLMEEELSLLGRIEEPALALQLHTHLGTTSILRGALRQAREHHARTLALYDPQCHRDLVLRFTLDPAVIAGVLSGWSLWLAGWPDQARSQVQQSLSWVEELGNPYSRIVAFSNAARVYLWCGAQEEVESFAEKGTRLAHEYGVSPFVTVGEVLRGCLHVERKEPKEGLSLLTQGISRYRSLGARYLLPLYLSSVAEALRQSGRIEEGLNTIAEALHSTETNLDVFWIAELHRLRGELLLRKVQPQKSPRAKARGQHSALRIPHFAMEAEECFLQALSIARQQEAKSLELRATMSLSRLWRQQGKKAEAGKLLAEIYSWFTEGFDTVDLREARTLLDDLRA